MDQPKTFLKGKVSFEIDQIHFEFKDKYVSLFGVSGLPWKQLQPTAHFGRSIMTTVEVLLNEPMVFRTRAYLTRENTGKVCSMGIQFRLTAHHALKLKEAIDSYGMVPPDHLRKYPRIPAYEWVGTFPIRARIEAPNKLEAVVDVADLSPQGVLFLTENALFKEIGPGKELVVYLEPRGSFARGVILRGEVCRTVDLINEKSGNLLRQIGVRFIAMDRDNRQTFLTWLTDILIRLKRNLPA